MRQLTQDASRCSRGRGASARSRLDSNNLGLGDSWQNPNPSNPRVVEVPTVDYTNVNGRSQLAPITGFAEVWLLGTDNHDNLQVIFIKAVSPGNIPGGNCQDFGSSKAVLTE